MGVVDAVGVTDADAVVVLVSDAGVDAERDALADALTDADVDAEKDALADALTDADALLDVDAARVAGAVGSGEADGLSVSNDEALRDAQSVGALVALEL